MQPERHPATGDRRPARAMSNLVTVAPPQDLVRP